MSRVEAYRKRAGECLASAKNMSSDAERQLLIDMAAIWHQLAETLGKFIDEHEGQDPEIGWRDQPFEKPPS
jgi:hypothetical protein